VLGFTFGVVQMGMYALYRNATPRVPAAKEAAAAADDGNTFNFKAPGEHVVTIAKLTAAAPATAAELIIKARDDAQHPPEEEAAAAKAAPAKSKLLIPLPEHAYACMCIIRSGSHHKLGRACLLGTSTRPPACLPARMIQSSCYIRKG
jgi:hypothetical protein